MTGVSGLVSVVMPVFNGEAYIAEAIESVLVQPYPQWELIVVDDGSTDQTRQVVETFGDPRIRYTRQTNQGQAAALNTGMALATGEYVTTLDADDWLTSESLPDRVQFLSEHAAYGAVYGDGFYCDAVGKPLARFSAYRPGNVTGDIYDVLIWTSLFGTGAPVMLRKRVLDQYALRYDERVVWCQDWEFYIRVAEHTTFGAIDTVTVRYRLHGSNMTTVLGDRRKREAVIYTEYKALASERFTRAAGEAKAKFFYSLLVEHLHGDPSEQDGIVASQPFKALPGPEQARLLRLMASGYLLEGKHTASARRWLRTAHALAPGDVRTRVAAALLGIHPALAGGAVRLWRQMQPGRVAVSPFDLAGKAAPAA